MTFYQFYPDHNDEKNKDKIRKYKKQISEEHKLKGKGQLKGGFYYEEKNGIVTVWDKNDKIVNQYKK